MKITIDNFKETINPLLIGLENNDNLMIINKYKKGEDNYIAALKGEMTIMKDELRKEDEKTIFDYVDTDTAYINLYENVDESLKILFNDFDKLEEEENKEEIRINKLKNKINKDFGIINVDEALNILFNDFDKLEEEENKEEIRINKLIDKLTNKINKDLNFDILNIIYKKYDITGYVDEIIIYFKEKNPIHIPLYDKTDFGIITEIYKELIKNIRG